MKRSLRIALVVNPIALHRRGGDHAPFLSRELLGRGHLVRGFGAPARMLPRVRGAGGARLVDFRPDVLLAYDGQSPAGWNAARAARQLGAPLFLLEEGHDPQGASVERVLRGFGQGLWGSSVRRQVRRVLALDDLARRQALERGFASERVLGLPGGVDVGALRPGLTSHLLSQHGVEGRVLLQVGPHESERGIEALLDAFARALGHRDGWSLVLAGDGPATRDLRARAARLGIAAQVHVLPRPRAEELPGLLGACTALVDPDGSGRAPRRVVPSALACGLPVVLVPGSRHADLAAGNGPELPDAGRDALVRGLEALAGDPARRERWSAAARRRATEELAWAPLTARLEGWLLEAADARVGGRRSA